MGPLAELHWEDAIDSGLGDDDEDRTLQDGQCISVFMRYMIKTQNIKLSF